MNLTVNLKTPFEEQVSSTQKSEILKSLLLDTEIITTISINEHLHVSFSNKNSMKFEDFKKSIILPEQVKEDMQDFVCATLYQIKSLKIVDKVVNDIPGILEFIVGKPAYLSKSIYIAYGDLSYFFDILVNPVQK